MIIMANGARVATVLWIKLEIQSGRISLLTRWSAPITGLIRRVINRKKATTKIIQTSFSFSSAILWRVLMWKIALTDDRREENSALASQSNITNAMMVPTQAVIPLARNKQIILLRKDSAQFLTVETGIRDSTYVQIVKGLKPGDTVVTSGLMAIRPKAKIKITKVNRYGLKN